MVLFAACDLDAAVQAERVSQRHLPRSGGRSEGQEGVEVAWQRPRSELSLRQFRIEDVATRSEEHTSELQSRPHLGCRLLLVKKCLTHSHSLDSSFDKALAETVLSYAVLLPWQVGQLVYDVWYAPAGRVERFRYRETAVDSSP